MRAIALPLVALLCLVVLFSSSSLAREGFVVLQFDDGRLDQYTKGKPILDQYGLPGSFGIVSGNTGKASAISVANLLDLVATGHEVHDHTLHHLSAFWGDDLNAPQWGDTLTRSRELFAQWGLPRTDGWNQPGGTGQGFSPMLADTLNAHGYVYAAGRVGMNYLATRNFHYNLIDSPLNLGRGGVNSWTYNAPSAGWNAVDEVTVITERIADGVAMGLVVVPLFHGIGASNSSEWGLAQICSMVADWQIPVVLMADAVDAVMSRSPDPFDEQMTNPTFAIDRDGNGRPDGWWEMTFAGLASNGAYTNIYGPEPGFAVFEMEVRATVCDLWSLHITAHKVAGAYGETWSTTSYPSMWNTACETWTTMRDTILIEPGTIDHLELMFYNVDDTVEVRNISWRRIGDVTSVPAATPSASLRLSVFPNPTAGPVTLQGDAGPVEVFDVLGRRVMTVKDRRADLSALGAGVYFFRLRNGERSTTTRVVMYK